MIELPTLRRACLMYVTSALALAFIAILSVSLPPGITGLLVLLLLVHAAIVARRHAFARSPDAVTRIELHDDRIVAIHQRDGKRMLVVGPPWRFDLGWMYVIGVPLSVHRGWSSICNSEVCVVLGYNELPSGERRVLSRAVLLGRPTSEEK
jgi:hypothetical protein